MTSEGNSNKRVGIKKVGAGRDQARAEGRERSRNAIHEW